MEKQKEFGSNFVSRGALFFLLALVVITSYYEMGVLPAFLLLVFLLAAVSLIWGKSSLRHLKLSLEGKSASSFPGEEIPFTLVVENEKWLPVIWLDLELPEPRRNCVDLEGGFCRKFTWLMPHQMLRWESRMRANRRGVYFLSEAELTSGDGFGLSVEHQKNSFSSSFSFVIYPRVKPVDVSRFLEEYSELQKGSWGHQEDVTLLKSSRGYQPGDAGKRINWRILARQSELVVNVYETVQPRNACFLLDLDSFTKRETIEEDGEKKEVLQEFHEEEMEDMLSLTASCIASLAERQVFCSLVLPTIGTQEGQVFFPESLDGMVPELLTRLAFLEYAGERSFLAEEAVLAAEHRFGKLYVVTESPGALRCRAVLEKVEDSHIRLLVKSKEGERQGGDYSLWEAQELWRERG
ncbi:DUF58 domain-containing protein [Hominifimenecus sp. rT4P-3]|uniref:DUF58 domain-containing protein n=1 Tax=Hominifimenecus sp. rT4P-3 TaxID=3242979 RepID=UPI003DA2F6B5